VIRITIGSSEESKLTWEYPARQGKDNRKTMRFFILAKMGKASNLLRNTFENVQ
jgi:hypothetical protein